MTRLLGAALVAAALAAVGGVQAKAPPGGIDLCGASGCSHIAGLEAEKLVTGWSASSAHPAAPAPFFVLHVPSTATGGEIVFWVPAAKLVRRGGGFAAWSHPAAEAEAVLEQAAAGLEPLRLELTRVTVGGRPVRAPATYVRLFRRGRWMPGSSATHWLRVRFESAVPSPWTDDVAEYLLSRRGRDLVVDVDVVRIPAAVAQRARLGLPLP